MDERQEAPVLPVGSGQKASGDAEPGVSVRVDENWQVSSMPEEKQFFSQDPNLFEAAVTAIKARLDEKDSNIQRTWLLTEVDHWDLEKERVILLSDNSIISVKYNFIHGTVEELKFIPLSHVAEMMLGEFKYPSSYGFYRTCKGIKVSWGRDDAVGFLDRWNPMSEKIPSTIFTSHVLLRRKKVSGSRLDVETMVPEVERAVQEYRRAHGKTEEFAVKPGDLIVNSLVGVSALIHNGSYLGFYKRRGAANW